MKSLIFIISIGCGKIPIESTLSITCDNVVCDQLSQELKKLGCLDLEINNPDADVSVEFLSENDFTRFSFTNEIGLWLPSTREILIHTENEFMQNSTLAHELGHALGLNHSDHGIMMPIIYPMTVSDSAFALVEAICPNR